MGTSQTRVIDPDVMVKAREYVNVMLGIMENHGDAPTLTPSEYDDLVMKCALPVQRARDARAK
jgi:hypothetical protein